MPIGLIIALVLAVGGGVSVAAQSSVPGDALYGVKVNINEEVRAAFALSAASKARVDVSRARERLEEAEELSVRTQVDARTRADIEARFQEFADQAEERIDMLADADARAAADIASNLEIALKAHEKVLANLAVRDSESRSEVGGLGARVSAEAREAAQARAEAEAKVRLEGNGPSVRTAAEGKLNAATNVIAAVRRFMVAQRDRMTADEAARAEARLKVAEDQVAQGMAKVQAGLYADAFNLGNAAIRTAQSVHLLVTITEHVEEDLEDEKIEEEGADELEEDIEGMERELELPVQASGQAEVEVELRLNF